MNLNSTLIDIFPSTKRGNIQRSARLFSEQNTSNIIKQLTSTNGFVITQFSEDVENPEKIPFEFNIYGYYVCLNNGYQSLLTGESNLNQENEIYAIITLQGYTVNDRIIGYEVFGTDNENTSIYNGITFSNTSEDSVNTQTSTIVKSLKILEKTENGNWQVPIESYAIFNQYNIQNLNLTIIDGGEIKSNN